MHWSCNLGKDECIIYKIDDCISYLRVLQSRYRDSLPQQSSTAASTKQQPPRDLSIQATGGGAFKFYDRIKQRLGVDVVQEDEMSCLIQGLDFFITEIPSEVFTYHDNSSSATATATATASSSSSSSSSSSNPAQDPPTMHYQPARSDVYPYLLVNIGSGVSMIKVSGPAQYQRIGGTSLGGGTLWGLLSLLTGARNFDDMLDMADRGDNSSVDLLVGDIYGEGTGYEKIGLSERTIASSFGKVLKRKREAEREAEDGSMWRNGVGYGKHADNGDGTGSSLVGDGRMFKPEDISRSLLYAISYVHPCDTPRFPLPHSPPSTLGPSRT